MVLLKTSPLIVLFALCVHINLLWCLLAAPLLFLIIAIVVKDFNYFEFITKLQATSILWQLDFIALLIYIGYGNDILWRFCIVNQLAWLLVPQRLVH